MPRTRRSRTVPADPGPSPGSRRRDILNRAEEHLDDSIAPWERRDGRAMRALAESQRRWTSWMVSWGFATFILAFIVIYLFR